MDTLETTIRPAQPGDAAAIAALYLKSRKALVPWAPLVHNDDDVRQWITQYLVPSGNVTVALLGDEIVGMCATSVENGVGWIDHLYLLPDHVGKEIGTALLLHVLPRLPLPVRLYTFQENEGARRFYERHGFVAVQFGNGSGNEEGVPDVLYERQAPPA